MRAQSFFARMRQESNCRVRPATNNDWPAVERLLYHTNRYYSTLEWRALQEWLGSPTLLLSIDQDERPVGLMLSVIDDGPIAWLRVIATGKDGCLKSLLEASAQAVLAQGSTGLTFLGDERWILTELNQANFQRVNQVITLRKLGIRPAHKNPPDIQVRAATADDIAGVLAVDHAAFEPMWWYSTNVLRRALSQTHCFDVAYLAGQCVGYQFSTLRHGRGHIVRLAIHPNRQRRGIGGRLASEALNALDWGGAEQITVNTQQDNQASLELYRRFGFDRVGKPWSVWYKSFSNSRFDCEERTSSNANSVCKT